MWVYVSEESPICLAFTLFKQQIKRQALKKEIRNFEEGFMGKIFMVKKSEDLETKAVK